jgi:(2Fe-2S) ferredoxin
VGKHDRDVVKVEKLMRGERPCLAVCAGKDCARAGAKHVIRAAQQALEEAGLAGSVDFALTKCQDYCDDGPTMTVLPGSYPYVELTPETVREVVLEHVRGGRPVLGRLHKRARRKHERRLA